MTDRAVTIAEFPDINQAAHAQMQLDAAGIGSVIEDGDIVTTMPFLNIGIKLKVMEKDAAQALELLKEKESGPETEGETPETKYAGFWLRIFAQICDGFVMGALCLPIKIGLPIMMLISPGMHKELTVAAYLLYIALDWLYFALMESSGYQATLGKKFFGIMVTDSSGNRISFLRASVRHWSKLLSTVTAGIGFIMAGLTLRKQALHDIVADCLVIRKYNTAKSPDKR